MFLSTVLMFKKNTYFSASLLNYKATPVLFTHNLSYDVFSYIMCMDRNDSGMVLHRYLLSDYIYE